MGRGRESATRGVLDGGGAGDREDAVCRCLPVQRGRDRPLGRVLPGGGQPAVGAVAPNDEVTGAIPQNGER
jgi:hypothetical protein